MYLSLILCVVPTTNEIKHTYNFDFKACTSINTVHVLSPMYEVHRASTIVFNYQMDSSYKQRVL